MRKKGAQRYTFMAYSWFPVKPKTKGPVHVKSPWIKSLMFIYFKIKRIKIGSIIISKPDARTEVTLFKHF